MTIRILDQDASVFKTIGLDKSKLVSNSSELKVMLNQAFFQSNSVSSVLSYPKFELLIRWVIHPESKIVEPSALICAPLVSSYIFASGHLVSVPPVFFIPTLSPKPQHPHTQRSDQFQPIEIRKKTREKLNITQKMTSILFE